MTKQPYKDTMSYISIVGYLTLDWVRMFNYLK